MNKITLEKLKVYQKFSGDIDGWARMGSSEEKENMSDEDWYIIDGLIMDIKLGRSNLEEILSKSLVNQEAIDYLIANFRNY